MKFQNNYYFVRQIYAFFLILIAFFICLYFFNRNSNIISQNNLVSSIIIEKSCSGSKRRSSLTLIYNQSTYNISLGRMDCTKYSKGDTLKLYYDKKNDILIKPGSVNHNLFQLTLASIALLFFLIPWKKILS